MPDKAINVRDSLIRFHLAQVEMQAAHLRGQIEQAEGSFTVTDAWREHIAEEAALFDWMAEQIRKLLPAEGS